VRPILFALLLLPFAFAAVGVAPAADESPPPSEAPSPPKEINPKEAKEIKEVVKKLQARYEHTRDLQADFTQTTQIEGFATPITSSGRVYIKKPGHLRWDYLDPNVEEIYVNKNDVMMYVPEHKQVLVGKLTQMAASQAPLQLLQGAAKLEEEFEVEPVVAGRGEGGLPVITLLPRSSEPESVRTVMKIVLALQPKTHFIKTVAIHEISGNISRFEFSHLKPNSGLQNTMFEFQVPEGVEVVKAPVLSPP
jgi:outer membrane lipoprotein carrier protein